MTSSRFFRTVALFILCLWAAIVLAVWHSGSPLPSQQAAPAASAARAGGASQGGQAKLASLMLREETPIPRLLSDTHPFEEELVELINQEREKAGVAPLTVSRKLAGLARRHSQDMGENTFFGHNSSDGRSFESRLKQDQYTYSAAAENIFAGNGPFNTPEAAIKAWINSPAHRANLLNSVYTEVGIGYRYVHSSPYGGYFTADFGKP